MNISLKQVKFIETTSKKFVKKYPSITVDILNVCCNNSQLQNQQNILVSVERPRALKLIDEQFERKKRSACARVRE